MPATQHLSLLLDQRLPHSSISILRTAARCAEELGHRVYLVGGSVRDLVVGRPGLDLDLSVEGDGPELAQVLAEALHGRATARTPFGTARVRLRGTSIDVATARKERYPYPGALPVVTGASIDEDLARRDFTVHAMACGILPDCWGELIDPYQGMRDIEDRQLKVLHDRSFVDDPTRMVRAVRYGARLRFELEEETARRLTRDRPGLARLSAARRWRELQRVLEEGFPERALLWADRLRLLTGIHPALSADPWLAAACIRARRLDCDAKTLPGIYFNLLLYRLPDGDVQDVLRDLQPSGSFGRPARDLLELRRSEALLGGASLHPSNVVTILDGCSAQAIRTLAVATEDERVGQRLRDYLTEWSQIKPLLPAEQLVALGVPKGAALGECLKVLRAARLDGLVRTTEDEAGMVRSWLMGHVGN